MSRASLCLQSLAALAMFALAAHVPAQAASPLEKNFYLSGPNFDGDLPRCEAALSNPRRFCSAVALVNDARWPQVPYRKHVVKYSIGEDTGFAGFDWGVEWCVTGYDLNWAYNPRCKMAGP
jgi:hypothetical protein